MDKVEYKLADSGKAGEKARPQWKKSWDFVFAAVGFSVGLGNLWRFPYLCFKNGGGAFLIPYVLFAIFIAIPCVVLDISVGQRMRQGLLQSWNISPIFKGIGLAQFVMLLNSSISYPIILAWTIKYLVGSFSTVLPWASCDNVWNSDNCMTFKDSGSNLSTNFSETVSAATEFWKWEVLHISTGIDHVGQIQTDLAIYLCIVWILMYLATFKGIKWSAKVVYVTATLPFPLLAIVLVRSLMLDGAAEGIKYYLIPDLGKLSDFSVYPLVWASACSQVLFSNGPGIGVIISLGSFNDRHHNFWRDAVTVVGMNMLASFVGGFAVFATLGSMATYQNTTVDKVATSGPGLAFIAYPETLSLLPLPQIWCVLFFLMILFLGYDSQFVCQETLVAVLLDNCRRVREHRYGRELAQALLCSFLFLLGLSMVTEGGVYLFELHSNYSIAGWCWMLIVTCECVAVAWCYGFDRYWNDVTDMIGERKLGKHWMKISWKFVAPLTGIVIAVYYMANTKQPVYEKYHYPTWAESFGHVISAIPATFIPGYAIYISVKTWRNGGNLGKVLRKTNDHKQSASEEMNALRPGEDIL